MGAETYYKVEVTRVVHETVVIDVKALTATDAMDRAAGAKGVCAVHRAWRESDPEDQASRPT